MLSIRYVKSVVMVDCFNQRIVTTGSLRMKLDVIHFAQKQAMGIFVKGGIKVLLQFAISITRLTHFTHSFFQFRPPLLFFKLSNPLQV